jgi:hypothetical protein
MTLSEARADTIGRRVELAFLAVTGALFVYALLRLVGSVGADAPFQPRRFVVLTGAMLLQPVSALLMRRSRRAGYATFVLSLMGLAATFAMTD